MEMYQFWTIVGMLAAGFGWIIHQTNELKTEINVLKTEMAVVKTVLIVKDILPPKLAKGE